MNKKLKRLDLQDYYIKDWKWPYKGIDDPRYIEDKEKFFKENGNGWFIYAGVSGHMRPKKYSGKDTSGQYK